MKATYELKENSQAELKVTIDGETWQNAKDKAFKKIAQTVELKGFRKGHAPLSMVKKAVGDSQIRLEAAQDISQEALEFGLNEYKEIRLVDRPTFDDIEALEEEEAVLVFGLTVYPTVKLGDYKSVEYKEDRVSVLKKDVDKEIENLRKEKAIEVLKEDGKVENGNIAVIDFEGFRDGVAFDGGASTEYPLEIGSGSFIPGFEEQIIGMETDEEKDIDVTFPEDYGAEDLAGVPVVFHVKVDAIKEKQLPELNDDFVKELELAEGVETVDQLTKYLKEQMTAQRKEEAEEKATDALLDGLLEVSEIDVPQVMIDSEIEDTFNSYSSRIQQQGLTMDFYLQIMGLTEAGFKEQIAPEAEKRLRIRLVLEAVADDLALEVTDEDVTDEYNALATQYEMDVEQIKSILPTDYLVEDLKVRKALDTLKTTNKKSSKKATKVKVEETKVEEEEKEEQ